MIIWIEILSARHKVLSRSRFETMPVHIGRSYASHMVIDEPSAAPTHLVIETNPDGGLVARGLDDSTFQLVGLSDPLKQTRLDGHCVLQIGKTLLRFRTDNDVLESNAPTPCKTIRHYKQITAQALLAGLPALLAIFLNTAEKWISNTDGAFLSEAVTTDLWMSVAIAGWAAAWGVLSYALNREGRLLPFLRIAGYGALAVGLTYTVRPLFLAALNLGTQESIYHFLTPLACGLAIIASFMTVLDTLRTRPILLASLSTVLLVAGTNWYQETRGDTMRAAPDIAKLAPPFLRLAPTLSKGHMIEQLAGMEKEAAATHKEAIPDELR